jgi:hypothetical protein
LLWNGSEVEGLEPEYLFPRSKRSCRYFLGVTLRCPVAQARTSARIFENCFAFLEKTMVERSFLMGGTKLDLTELAAIFDVTERTIQTWAVKACGGKKKVYDLKVLASWRCKQLEEEIQRLRLESGNSAKVRKYEAEARLAEMKVLELEGTLVQAEVVQRQWSDAINRAKSKFMALPDRLALELSQQGDPAIVRARLQEVIVEALSELSSS